LARAQFDKDMAAFFESGGVKSKGLQAQRRERREAKELKGSKARDPDAPKRLAGGAFGRWLAENREEVKKTLPADHKITDVTKKAGEMWKALPQSEKQKYEDVYKNAQEQYVKEMEAYTAKKKAERPADEVPEAKTPKKRKVAEGKGDMSATKRGRKSKSKISPEPVGVELGDDILGKARAAGYESQLKNLALRPDVVACGKLASELLKALEASNGLVNPAKRALLGA